MTLMSKYKNIVFWILTALLVVSQFASGVMDLLQAKPVLEGVLALGYPAYLLYILGPAKIMGVIVIAAPGFLRLKEWAYAGFFFDFLGAFLSHTFNGDPLSLRMPALIALFVALGSYALRPESRRLPGPVL